MIDGNAILQKVNDCVAAIRKITDFKPEVAIILGSGLGNYADNIKVECEISYLDIPGFPVSTVPGHEGKFIFGYVDKIPVICMKGRVHFYEGYDISDVVLPTRVMKYLGARILFLTNASGGINYNYEPGNLMLIKDHISCFVPNPLIGPNIDEFGTRFPDMSYVYDRELSNKIHEAAIKCGIDLKEGIYAQLTGPSFESPAEIRMLRNLGADAVGMSTVVEAITAAHLGMRVCGVSFVTNLAAGMLPEPLSHEDVQKAADKNGPLFEKLVTESVKMF